MTQSSTIGTEHTQSIDSTGSGKVQLSFNPMHPSMELPPEQLIRLLGVETKKTRKARHAQEATVMDRHPAERQPLVAANIASSRPEPAPAREDARSKRTVVGRVAVITGLLTSIGVIAYLALGGGQQQEIAETPASRLTTPKPAAAHINDAHGQAAIDAELLRLRNEAEQRFDQRAAEGSLDRKTVSRSEGVDAPPSAMQSSGADTAVTEPTRAYEEENFTLEATPAPATAAAPEAEEPRIE